MAKYDVKVRYAFEGTYTVVAEDRDQAERMVTVWCWAAISTRPAVMTR